jgi:sugar/nucleoside kinase (ribokinase family)
MGPERILADAEHIEHITHTNELLLHTARRAQDKPGYVAFALSRYQARHGLTDEALAGRLGCASLTLPRLALCLAPRQEHRAENLAQIAGMLGLDPQILSVMLIEGERPFE